MTIIIIVMSFFSAIVGALFGAWAAFKYQATMDKTREKRSVLQTLMMHRGVWSNEDDWGKS